MPSVPAAACDKFLAKMCQNGGQTTNCPLQLSLKRLHWGVICKTHWKSITKSMTNMMGRYFRKARAPTSQTNWPPSMCTFVTSSIRSLSCSRISSSSPLSLCSVHSFVLTQITHLSFPRQRANERMNERERDRFPSFLPSWCIFLRPQGSQSRRLWRLGRKENRPT